MVTVGEVSGSEPHHVTHFIHWHYETRHQIDFLREADRGGHVLPEVVHPSPSSLLQLRVLLHVTASSLLLHVTASSLLLRDPENFECQGSKVL